MKRTAKMFVAWVLTFIFTFSCTAVFAEKPAVEKEPAY